MNRQYFRMLLALLLVLSLTPPLCAKTKSGTLFMDIKGLKNKTGDLLVYLYDKKDTFPVQVEKALMAKKLPLNKFAGTVSFEAVPFGTYAVSVIHDEDSSGKLSIGLFGPSESVGSSNDAKGFFGPPGFDDAKFVFGKDKEHIVINMN